MACSIPPVGSKTNLELSVISTYGKSFLATDAHEIKHTTEIEKIIGSFIARIYLKIYIGLPNLSIGFGNITI